MKLDSNKCRSTCRVVYKQHIKRAWFIAKLYKTAYMAYPVADYTPIYYGWELSKCGNYQEINWFEGDQVPPETVSLEETSISNEEMFNEHDEDSGDNVYESDESDNDDSSHYDDFWFQNHLEDIISYNATLFFMLLFTRFFIMIEWLRI